MIEDIYVFKVIIVTAAVTVLLRTIPFIAVKTLSSNKYLKFIGKKMPIGVMTLLVTYTLIDIDFSVPPYGLPQLVSLIIALILYWKFNNALLSIGIALILHLLIVNSVLFYALVDIWGLPAI
jgi:branched-subunit amino acid transport protein AzlD